MTLLFKPGQIVATPGALEALAANTVKDFSVTTDLITRHLRGDWGDLDEHDRLANDRAVKEGTRLLSAYHLQDGTKLWIITEADRSATTILLPEEY